MSKYSLINNRLFCEKTEIPVVWKGDVIVAGGGPGGLGAAVASARNNCSTLMVERYGFVGGMCSYGCGMPLGGAYPAYRTIGGIAEELLSATRNAGPESASVRDVIPFSYWYFHDSEYFRVLAFEFIEKSGVELLLHTMVTDVIQEGERVIGLTIESKSGRQAVLGEVIIDATGDADVAAWAGAQYVKGGPDDGAMMAVTIPYIMADVDVDKVLEYTKDDKGFSKALAKAKEEGMEINAEDKFTSWHVGMRPNTIFSNIVRVRNIDGTNVKDLTRGEMEGRKRIMQHMNFFRKYVPGFEKAYVAHSGEQVGVRDTRRIVGESYLSTDDCMELRKRPDTILRCGGPLDNVTRGNELGGPIAMKSLHDWFDIPYGCIVPKGLDNVLISGRTLSSSHLAQAGSRGMALLLGMGQGAGTAAAIIAKRGIKAREVDVKELQGLLIAQGMDLGI